MSYVTSNIPIVCFGIKKCMFFDEKKYCFVFGSVSCVSVLFIIKEKRYPVWSLGTPTAVVCRICLLIRNYR